ncbi:LysR substrate-binding domain-containing protein [Glaciimonas sp. CA11.2]|uniref:LysR family transcriptional regulator n=1 Tax=unclassified Glaciimonas TaxID=2644401 RepID=UPI002AB4D9BE|nr:MULTISPECIES: LysR substrate-binding domain-containing protein [unclassified Glaciimonas]MDY7548321.1 LysR substrate-binding domain-containing protein [Glaciimonas sp. CA11.2]MEB0010529.1 LysR substrate-binding domain-containing protein [Glaciimonas sp. Cout2]MEB0083521.1 LysR substrate-binding domain-containing protein [Glaciimonas sp. Gout2]MEB0162352.1 LysR substrate-binding domain-containing protein [Glaciimonas sp. CA11.2]
MSSESYSMADLATFALVAQHKGFRQAARASEQSASTLSEAIRRLENQLGIRLLLRTTRSVTPTEAGALLLRHLMPALDNVHSALDVLNDLRDSPRGTLRLNVPVVAARFFLLPIINAFMSAYPDITVEVVVDNNFVDVIASGCDAGIRYGEELEQDMIAVPIGPRKQRFAVAAAPSYLALRGMPIHPRDLMEHACLRGKFLSGAMHPWEFERDGKKLCVEPTGPLIITPTIADIAVSAAVAGHGIIYLFEEWLAPYLESGQLVPILEEWWPRFPGPFLYFSGRRHLPAPLRAFVDFIQTPV